MASEKPNPRIGVAAIIYGPNGEFVAGKRKGSHGAGTWQLPGGHLEYGESITDCAEREALEETGLKVRGVKIAAVTNVVFVEDVKHYVTLFVRCEMEDVKAQPELLEPEKCEGWSWKTWDELKKFTGQGQGEKLFLPIEHLIEQTEDLEQLRL